MNQILLGLILGLLSATITESFGHRIFGHPNALQLKIYNRFPRIFSAFLRAHAHHTLIHHHRCFQTDILTQFENLADKKQVDDWIDSNFTKDFSDLVQRESYNLTLKGLQGTLPFAAPFLFGPLCLLFFFGKTIFIYSLITAFLPVLASKYLHPIVHCPEDLDKASWIVRQVAKTSYMRWMFTNHYLHHREARFNFNLLLGGDHLLRAFRKGSQSELEECDRLWEIYCCRAKLKKASWL